VRAVGGHTACPKCGGGVPGEVHDDLVCRCGETDQLTVAWDLIRSLIFTRSAGKCEIRSPSCLAADVGYEVGKLEHHLRSLHHRRPRGMGGSRRVDTHTAAALVLTCGHGTLGCHHYVEQHREWGRARGLIVPQGTDPADVPLVLPSGRRVRLDPWAPAYLPPTDGPAYAAG
jgi:hypothetical protein